MNATPLDAAALVRDLRSTFATGRTRSLRWRRAQLDAMLRMLEVEQAAFLAALADDLGKSADEAYLTEVGVTIAEIKNVQRHLEAWLRPRHVFPGLALLPAVTYSYRQPLGVALIIAPWNYPLQLALSPLIGAIAAGNAVVVKPSEVAPATSRTLARLMGEYLDPEAIRVVEGGVDETTELLREPWDTIFYTGNGKVARIIAAAAAQHLTPTTLELGGKSPVFVDASCDVEAAARRIVWGKFTNAGQTCVAPDYVLATREVRPALERALAAAITEMYGEQPEQSPDYGRIINERHFDRVSKLLSDTVGAGATVVTGGGSDRAARYIAPTVLSGVARDAAVMGEEIFGPILPILDVASADEAIARINDGDKPLALYVLSEDRTVRRSFLRRTSSGSITFGIPVAHLSVPNLPFGGVGESGMGNYHGEASIRAFSHERSVAAKPLAPDTMRLVYPPIDARRSKLLRRLLG